MWLRMTPSALRLALQDAAVNLLAYLAGKIIWAEEPI